VAVFLALCHFSGDNILIVVNILAVNIIRSFEFLELISVITGEP